MKTCLALLIGLLLFPRSSWAQSSESVADSPRTSAFIELLGNAGLYSLNLERMLTDAAAVRVGFGTWSGEDFFGGGSTRITTLPVMASYFVGSGSSKLEVGAGLLFGKKELDSSFGGENDEKSTIIDMIGVVGYRYQRPAGHFLFRVGVTPFFTLQGDFPDEKALISGGISFGFRF